MSLRHRHHRRIELPAPCPGTRHPVLRSTCVGDLGYCWTCSTDVRTVASLTDPRVRYIAFHAAAPAIETRSL